MSVTALSANWKHHTLWEAKGGRGQVLGHIVLKLLYSQALYLKAGGVVKSAWQQCPRPGSWPSLKRSRASWRPQDFPSLYSPPLGGGRMMVTGVGTREGYPKWQIARTVESLEYVHMIPSFSSLDLLARGDKVRDIETAIGFGKEEPIGVSADLARPLHFFRNLVAIGCRVLHSHKIGRSGIERSQVRRGQMQTQKSYSFC